VIVFEPQDADGNIVASIRLTFSRVRGILDLATATLAPPEDEKPWRVGMVPTIDTATGLATGFSTYIGHVHGEPEYHPHVAFDTPMPLAEAETLGAKMWEEFQTRADAAA